MNGIETLKIIRKDYPLLPVIMVGRLTEKGASETIDALFFGANDYVSKPTASGGIAHSINTVRKQLLPKIRALYRGSSQHTQSSQASAVVIDASSKVRHKAVKIIAIGLSTGGPNALSEPCLSGCHRHPPPVVC